jgi:dephospho-CoA kinase
MKFIAVCGLNGSGKGVVAEIVKKNYPEVVYISARELIYKAAEKAGVKISDRDDLNRFNEDRAKEGRLLYDDILDFYEPLTKELYLFESLRRVAELKKLKEKFGDDFIVIAVEANEELRYKRISERGSETDKVTLEKFREQERKENESQDDFVMNIGRCMELADFKIKNEGTLEEFEQNLLTYLKTKL